MSRRKAERKGAGATGRGRLDLEAQIDSVIQLEDATALRLSVSLLRMLDSQHEVKSCI